MYISRVGVVLVLTEHNCISDRIATLPKWTSVLWSIYILHCLVCFRHFDFVVNYVTSISQDLRNVIMYIVYKKEHFTTINRLIYLNLDSRGCNFVWLWFRSLDGCHCSLRYVMITSCTEPVYIACYGRKT